MSRRRRLDAELVRRGIALSRAQAQDLIDTHRVLVSGSIAYKSARQVDPGESIEVEDRRRRFVGRGGYKLEGALDRFAVEVAGSRVIDAGSSTGGFTDCALQYGAREVVAIDVGRNQLHEKIRADRRVSVYEQTNIRGLDPETVGGRGDVLVSDLSFISLRTVLDSLLELVVSDGDLVLLVKPQFEAGKAEVDRARGVIRDPAVWERTLRAVCLALEKRGAVIMDVMVSPITGSGGNVEFLVHASPSGTPARHDLIADAIVSVAEKLGGQ